MIEEELLSSLIDKMIIELKDKSVIPEVGDAVIAELNKKRRKLIRRKSKAQFETAVQNIFKIYDRHMYINYVPERISYVDSLAKYPEVQNRAEEKIRADEEKIGYGFSEVNLLPGDIGYIKIDKFCRSDAAFKRVASIMDSLSISTSFIIDLRESRGGSPDMVAYISSYFFAESLHLNSIYCRYTDKTDEYWTIEDLPGRKFIDTDLYILTSSSTFSGAEEFAYNMQNLARATIIGETTGGGAHPTEEIILNEDFVLGVPTGEAINPITKTNWEMIGVVPEIKIKSKNALKKALKLISQ